MATSSTPINGPGTITNSAIVDGTRAALDAGTRLAEPTRLEEGKRYAFLVPDDGDVKVIDNDRDEYRHHPRRKQGTVTVRDAASFNAYIGKHGLPSSEIWADPVRYALVGVINAHGPAEIHEADDTADGEDDVYEGLPGWGDHRVRLDLAHTPGWKAWAALNNKLIGQVEFAEHVEQRLADIVKPKGADMLELAQTFSAQRDMQYESSQRLQSGETKLTWHEQVDAKSGRRGDIAVPEAFTLALVPFEGSKAYPVTARFRYRIQRGGLLVGYVLDRPEDVLRAAFDDIVGAVHDGCPQPVFTGTP